MSGETINIAGSMRMPVAPERFDEGTPIFEEGDKINMAGDFKGPDVDGPFNMNFDVIYRKDNHTYIVYFEHSKQYFDLFIVRGKGEK